ncbi:hypothetical protein [Variovorax sp. PCZ-1]|uniref:hypothetical protein n=1 Tax=Variovorax sp. PCZ-1 TaxID=2835533 RepID=UPI001BCBB543|nr:hypothetical protein [Variovorax sp. PCZ-1]MBS7806256.1 hypothetical protein [Variovorax sp. PCZ-1]
MFGQSRFQLNAETGLPDIRDFAEFGAALRSMSTDGETHRLSDGMGELSAAIERVGKALSSHQRGATVGPLLVDLLTALRKHRQLVVSLSESWRSLYEYASYLAALNNFRVLVGQWLVERNISGDNEVVIEDFEMIGWRTLGEGLMMIDIHEQALSQAHQESALGNIDESRLAKAKNWWGQLRGKQEDFEHSNA